jgi:hypothetical protein
MFGSKVFSKYFSNTLVSQNTTVSNTLMCLAVTKNCGINTSISLKTCYFLKYWKNNSGPLFFFENEVLLAQAVKYYSFVILQF